MQKGAHQKLKKKIRLNYIIFAAITMVAIITLLSFWFVSNQKFFDLITERVVEDYAQTTTAVKKNVETLISYTEDFSKYVALDDRMQNLMVEHSALSSGGNYQNTIKVRNEWEDISARLIYSTSRLAGFGVYDDEELLYGFLNFSTTFDTDIISQEDLDQAKRQKEPLWTGLLTLETTNPWNTKKEYAFSVLKYVQGGRGEWLGTVALFVRESSFSDIFANTEDTWNRQFYLVDQEGRIVSAEDKSLLFGDAREVLGLTDTQYRECLEKEQFLLEPEDGIPILYVTSSIEGTPFRLVGQTVLEELQVQRNDLRLFMQMVLLLSLAAAIAASWFVSKQVTKPLKQIIRIMKQIEDSSNKEKLRCPVDGIEEVSLLGYEFNRLMDKVDEAAEQIYQEQRQRRHNEVRLLQAQIVPHFLYNTLGMISSLIKLNRQEEAREAIQNLASFYRLSLSGGNEYIPIREEMELTRNYLELQRMRYIEYVDYMMVHDENAGEFIIPKLMIQPLVENVLNHGLNPDGKKCTIRIETKYDEEQDCCVISVSDNGRGISKERLEQIRDSLKNEISLTKSFGLLNIYQRMKLLYGEAFTMDVDSVEGEYTVFTLTMQDVTEKYQERD